MPRVRRPPSSLTIRTISDLARIPRSCGCSAVAEGRAWAPGAHQAVAKETEDADVVAATTAKPGVVLRRPAGPTSAAARAVGTTRQGGRSRRSRLRPKSATRRSAALAFERERRRHALRQAEGEAGRTLCAAPESRLGIRFRRSRRTARSAAWRVAPAPPRSSSRCSSDRTAWPNRAAAAWLMGPPSQQDRAPAARSPCRTLPRRHPRNITENRISVRSALRVKCPDASGRISAIRLCWRGASNHAAGTGIRPSAAGSRARSAPTAMRNVDSRHGRRCRAVQTAVMDNITFRCPGTGQQVHSSSPRTSSPRATATSS